jgi:hypothetical protein
MQNDTGKDPKALPDEALDEAAGGVLPGFQGQITDGTSNIATDPKAGTSFAGDGLGSSHGADSLTKTGTGTLDVADGSVKPAG